MRRQISQSKLARSAGMSSSAVQQIEADMREGPGTHPDNAASLLRVLDAMEPLTDQELVEFVEYFPVRSDVVQSLLSTRQAASMFASKTPEERARFAIDVLTRLVGIDELSHMLEVIAIAAHESARRARESVTGKPQPSAVPAKRPNLTRTLERDGMHIEERIPISESGDLLRPVPAGQGLIDDPNLALAEAAKAAEDALRTAAASQHKPSLRDVADKLAAARSRAGA